MCSWQGVGPHQGVQRLQDAKQRDSQAQLGVYVAEVRLASVHRHDDGDNEGSDGKGQPRHLDATVVLEPQCRHLQGGETQSDTVCMRVHAYVCVTETYGNMHGAAPAPQRDASTDLKAAYTLLSWLVGYPLIRSCVAYSLQ